MKRKIDDVGDNDGPNLPDVSLLATSYGFLDVDSANGVVQVSPTSASQDPKPDSLHEQSGRGPNNPNELGHSNFKLDLNNINQAAKKLDEATSRLNAVKGLSSTTPNNTTVLDARCIPCQIRRKVCDMYGPVCIPCKSRGVSCTWPTELESSDKVECLSCQEKGQQCDSQRPTCGICRKEGRYCQYQLRFSSLSCMRCRQPKRSCDGQRPKCSTCKSWNQSCRYSYSKQAQVAHPDVNKKPSIAVEIVDLDTEGDSSEERYEVESIVKHRIRKGTLQYLINWKGYSIDDCTWEPLANLRGAEEIVNEYQSNIERQSVQPGVVNPTASKPSSQDKTENMQYRPVASPNFCQPPWIQYHPQLPPTLPHALPGTSGIGKHYPEGQHDRSLLSQSSQQAPARIGTFLGHRWVDGTLEYLIRWNGDGSQSWERVSNLAPLQGIVNGFTKRNGIENEIHKAPRQNPGQSDSYRSSNPQEVVQNRLLHQSQDTVHASTTMPRHQGTLPQQFDHANFKSALPTDGIVNLTNDGCVQIPSRHKSSSTQREGLTPKTAPTRSPFETSTNAADTSQTASTKRRRSKKSLLTTPKNELVGQSPANERYILVPKNTPISNARPLPSGPYTKETVASNILLASNKHPWLCALNARLDGLLDRDGDNKKLHDARAQHARGVEFMAYISKREAERPGLKTPSVAK